MACFRPIPAFELDEGGITFVERGRIKRPLFLPCNSCIGCRMARARAWGIRCVHESRCHLSNSFITLTYSDEFFPFDGGLHYRDFQLFMKRLRFAHSSKSIRFYACGEYGDRLLRPHFHALIFGHQFSDLRECGKDLYESKELDSLWGKGICRIGDVSFASASYVAKYCVKKLGAKIHTERYRRLDSETGEVFQVSPEVGHMSRRPGLGYVFFQRYWRDVYLSRDGVCQPGGQVLPAPKYYDSLLQASAPRLFEEKQFERYLNSQAFKEDCLPERLRVREFIAEARFHQKARSVE